MTKRKQKRILKPEVICKHCGASVDLMMIVGLSPVCPVCKKPQNGRMGLSPENLLEGV